MSLAWVGVLVHVEQELPDPDDWLWVHLECDAGKCFHHVSFAHMVGYWVAALAVVQIKQFLLFRREEVISDRA